MEEGLWPYEQVLTDLRQRIGRGELSGRLPSRLALTAEYQVSHMTVQRAIDALKREGVLYSRPGLGVFVRKDYDPGGV